MSICQTGLLKLEHIFDEAYFKIQGNGFKTFKLQLNKIKFKN